MYWGDKMSDYKEMYLKMFRASEQAVNILLMAQKECEEHYISSTERCDKLTPLPFSRDIGVDNE